MAGNAQLRILLMADEKVIAESDDPSLWQAVLSKLYASTTRGLREEGGQSMTTSNAVVSASTQSATDTGFDLKTEEFAQQVGVESPFLVGACRPKSEAPYLTLDSHCWEAMKKQIPQRGRHAIGPVVVAGTLLALWARVAELPKPTVADANRVLGTIEVRDQNPARALRNCVWLQTDGDRILLNPAKISFANQLAKAFCTKDWTVLKRKASA